MRSEAGEYSTCTSWSLEYCAVQCGTALTRQHLRGSPFPAGPHHASRARKRKEATYTMYRHRRSSFWGRGHVAVTVIALFLTVQYHLSNLCPEEEPLSSFGFAPLSSPSNGDRQTSTPARPGTVRPVTFGGLGVAPTFECAPLGNGMASRARPVGTGSAQSTFRYWSTGGVQKYIVPACGTRFSLTACPGGTFPRNQGRGAMQSGKEGGRGVKEATPVPASQPDRQTCQPAQRPVPSAQCQSQRQCDPRFPVSVPKVYLTLSVSHPAPRPSLLILSSPKPVTAPKSVSAAVAASNPRSLFANTLRKSSSTPVIRFVFLFSFRQPV